MKREPLLLPALALSLGILIAFVHPLAHGRLQRQQWRRSFFIWEYLPSHFASALSPHALLIFALAAGLFTASIHRETRSPKLNAEDGESLVMSGCVSEPPVFSPGREQFTLDLAPKTSARISVNLRNGTGLPIRYGQMVEATVKIRTPRNFGNPGIFITLPIWRRRTFSGWGQCRTRPTCEYCRDVVGTEPRE